MRALLLGALAAALLAVPARAGDGDLQLWRLGSPDPYVACVACNGAPGDKVQVAADPLAQRRFARLSAVLGLAFIPPFQEPAGTTGQSGFEIGFSGAESYLKLAPDEWPTQATQATAPAPAVLFLPTLALRKGFGGSLEVGTAVGYLTGTQMFALTGELRWAPVDGVDYAPDLALRLYGTRVLGTQEMDLLAAGADLSLSKSFGLGGVVKLQPYLQYGVALINAASSVVDFRPQSEDPKAPTDDDRTFHTVGFLHNRYSRGVAGVRLVAGAVVLGLEGGVSLGTNPVQLDPLSGGVPKQFTRIWTSAARLGLAF